jgi:RNA polymerase sigma factor (sigma-70 family)
MADMTEPQAPREHAFEALYRDEFAFVWTTARRLGVTPAIQEDVVQDVFLTAYRRLDQLRFEVSARAWLYGVTRRVAARYRRSASRTARRMTAVAHARQGPGPAPQERWIAAQQLELGLARLGGGTRAAFEMAEVLGMSGPEIAAELGLPVATVYSRIRLAREQLARELSSPQVDRGIAALREADAPEPASMQRCWLVVLPGLSAKSGGAGLGAWLTARALATTLVVAGTGAVVLASRDAPRAAPRAEPTSDAAAPSADGEIASDRGEAPRGLDLREADDPGRAPGGDRRRRADDIPGRAQGEVRRDPAAEDRLGAEVALLDRARDQLRRDPAAARALLGEHARRFPAGALADVRGALEVEALCLAGDLAGAAARAATLRAQHPGSAAALRFAAPGGGEDNFSCD